MIRKLGKPGDLGWVVQSHAELYAAEYGWGQPYETLIAQIVAAYATEHDDAREAGWIAEVDGERVGSVFCMRGPDEATAKLRLLLVAPEARGRRLGAELVDTCLAFAREVGYKRMVLWTNDPLVAARHIYLARGFTLTSEEPHDAWGESVVGQTYEVEL
ncbi:GNAT family N-acetyltransferase [Kribbella sandramycini]|uniref:GNAT family N-acetyltransferase n=1 Tax=Kribbella sandramycini TaxID=60450 RepID=A0A7Y4NYG3_9ACTN|nr:GNAT family N-acetyltransferase [Kribbella sandramycini]MBB6568282.1 GNAT superfamily N-acetyltransferase [Kribbella sandramycini]NOL39125.1 GNAT family N-acetyltransferase [Kribbella sandramycini]